MGSHRVGAHSLYLSHHRGGRVRAPEVGGGETVSDPSSPITSRTEAINNGKT